MHKAWSSIGEVPYCFSRSSVKSRGRARQRIVDFDPNLAFLDCNSVWIHIWWKMIRKAGCYLGEVPYLFSRSSVKFQGHTAKKPSILTQIGRFRTVTPVWIHCWIWNDAQSLKQHRRGTLFFKVVRQIARSHGTKNGRFWPELSVSGL